MYLKSPRLRHEHILIKKHCVEHYHCVPTIASPEARTDLIRTCFEKAKDHETKNPGRVTQAKDHGTKNPGRQTKAKDHGTKNPGRLNPGTQEKGGGRGDEEGH